MRAFHQLFVAALACLIPSTLTAQVVMPDGSVVSSDAVRRAPAACNKGDSLACNAVGFAALEGAGQMLDIEDAVVAFRKACALGSGIGCEREGFIASSRHDKAQDLPLAETRRKQAAAIFTTACDEGNPLACHWFAGMLQGSSAIQDTQRAVRLYATACFDHAFGQSCRDGYNLTYLSTSPVHDKAMAARFEALVETAFDAECKAGRAGSCASLAAWVRSQRGVNEAAYILELAEQACNGWVAYGCEQAGLIAARMDPGPAGWDRQYALFERACRMQSSRCTALTEMMRNPREGWQADPYLIYFNDMSACVGGDEGSCWLMYDYADKLAPGEIEAFVLAFDHACLKLPRVWAEVCAAAGKNHVERASIAPAGAANDLAEARRLYARALELPDDDEDERDAHGEARAFLARGN